MKGEIYRKGGEDDEKRCMALTLAAVMAFSVTAFGASARKESISGNGGYGAMEDKGYLGIFQRFIGGMGEFSSKVGL